MKTRVLKLLPRHTEAGISIRYDGCGVGLYCKGSILKCCGKTAFWPSHDVSVLELTDFADAWMESMREAINA